MLPKEHFMACVNCSCCYRCSKARNHRCFCEHQVVPYGSKEWQRRFLASNPTAKLIGRQGVALVARYADMPFPVRLVGGTPEAPTCIQTEAKEIVPLSA